LQTYSLSNHFHPHKKNNLSEIWINQTKVAFFVRKRKGMQHVGQRIKKLREAKNLTQEFMANNLKISQNSYSRIETENTKLTTEHLSEIATILEVPAELIISNEAPSYTINNQNVDKYYTHIENLYEDQKEMHQTSIKILEDQLKHYQQENKRLMGLVEKMMG
jgi:transcriptional regulator with XRE-family HTH domain